MYWFRESIVFFIPWLIIMGITSLGGWMIVSRAFNLESKYRLLIGMGFGLGFYLFLTNLCGYIFSAKVTFILPAFLVLFLGFALAFRNRKLQVEWKDLNQWKILLFGLVMVVFSTRIEQGLAISDDPKNLTLISELALGNIPPHHYLDATRVFSYHYGFHLLGASLMSIGNAMPWSAFDISKAILTTYSLILVYLLASRYIKARWGAIITTALYSVVGGTRWLFYLVPLTIIKPLDKLISLQGTSALMNVPFTQAIYQTWTIDGGPPLGYLFGFMNSLNGFFFNSHVGTGTLGAILLLLIWLTLNHTRSFSSFFLYVPLLALCALSTETSYGMFAFGVVVIALFALIRKKRDKRMEMGLLLALVISIPIVAFQGGVLTNRAASVFSGNPLVTSTTDEDSTEESNSMSLANFKLMGFSLRWPPAIPNAHLGSLSILNPYTLLAAILEIGPFLLIIPWVIAYAWKKYKEDDIYWGIITASSIVAFLIPIFVQYYVDRDITKIMGFAISNWKLQFLLFVWVPITAINWKKYIQKAIRAFAIFSTVLAAMGGIVVTISNFSAISQPVLSHRINSLDAYVSRDTWNKLKPSALIFDRATWRGSALTGLQTKFGTSSTGTPEWNEINKAATIENLFAAGYQYVYIDKEWWYNLPASSRESLSQPCVSVVTEYVDDWPLDIPDFRRLIDISGCVKK